MRSGPGKIARARRQANAAVALFRLGKPERVWPLLEYDESAENPDGPRLRTYLIHKFAPVPASLRTRQSRSRSSWSTVAGPSDRGS